jgi:hypothetical protein
MVLSKCQCGIAQLTNNLTRHPVEGEPLIVLFLAEWEGPGGPVYSDGQLELKDGPHPDHSVDDMEIRVLDHEKIIKKEFEHLYSIGRPEGAVDYKAPKTACFYVNAEDLKNRGLVFRVEEATNTKKADQPSYKKSLRYIKAEKEARGKLDKTHQ